MASWKWGNWHFFEILLFKVLSEDSLKISRVREGLEVFVDIRDFFFLSFFLGLPLRVWYAALIRIEEEIIHVLKCVFGFLWYLFVDLRLFIYFIYLFFFLPRVLSVINITLFYPYYFVTLFFMITILISSSLLTA